MLNLQTFLNILWALFLAIFLTCFSPKPATAQEAVLSTVKTCLKTGSSKELTRSFHTSVELSFDGEKSNYSRSQAEFVLKDFFKENPPKDFQYIHQGESKEGLKYVIGEYSYSNGTYRVLVFLKNYDGETRVDYIDFSEE